jgi:cytochrome c biogenesis factor
VLGIAACSIGLIAILGLLAVPLAVIGLVLGIFGIVRARRGFGTGKTMAMAGTVLCVLGLVLAVIGIVNASTAFIDRDSPGEVAGGRTQEIQADDLDVQFDKFVDDGNPSIETGKLPVTLTNKGKDNASFSVQLEAVDAAGKRIDDDTAYAPNLAPGQSTTTYMFVLVASNKLSDMKRATFRIVEVSKY